jgi:2,4-dienoyl-CoA reductase-like NADH-dependent reductase (Old Yellow Enzyme family)
MSHGTPLEASFITKYNRFLILAVNQDVQQATGCSIDKSVEFIQKLEQKYKVDLLDKMNVTYKQGEFLTHKSLLDFKRMAKEKAVSENTIVFNNLVNTIEEWKENWEVPASDSWHSRFF